MPRLFLNGQERLTANRNQRRVVRDAQSVAGREAHFSAPVNDKASALTDPIKALHHSGEEFSGLNTTGKRSFYSALLFALCQLVRYLGLFHCSSTVNSNSLGRRRKLFFEQLERPFPTI
jgi:hypothetical protein